MQTHLTIESLSKTFVLHSLNSRRLHAFGDVSFTVAQGTFVGLSGRSGSGKSSLLRCIYRSYLPTTGSILYSSHSGVVDLANADDRTVLRLRRREIGYVSQSLWAVPRTPARNVVAEPLVDQGTDVGEARERASVTLATLGLSPELQETYPATMSGGERQRVNLARALVTRPRLLLLDEPTSALDSETRTLAVEALMDLKETGTTMVGIFHDADTVGTLADQVVVLGSGRVRWSGPVEEATGHFAEA